MAVVPQLLDDVPAPGPAPGPAPAPAPVSAVLAGYWYPGTQDGFSAWAPFVEPLQPPLPYSPVGSHRIVVNLEPEHAGYATPRVRRWTDADQKARYPNDRGLEFVAHFAEREMVFFTVERLKATR